MNFFFAGLPHLQLLAELEHQCFGPHAWHEAQLLSHLKSGGKILMTTDNSAYLVYIESSFETEILRIGVKPEERRKGLAEKLLGRLVAAHPGQTIFLEVRTENLPAIRLYQKFGFVQTGVRKKYYADGSDAILFMLGVL